MIIYNSKDHYGFERTQKVHSFDVAKLDKNCPSNAKFNVSAISKLSIIFLVHPAHSL